ncbi:MAG: hypothetical protein KAH86_03630 [Methanosarcinales archaeon]|nr:hypothetical protein [Methanosarcinales archaeon]
MNKYTILIILIFVALSASGCLEPQEITPASIPDTVLDRLKWEQAGEPEIDNQQIDISEKMTVGVNIAKTTFQDLGMMEDMSEQLSEYKLDFGGGGTAQLIVIRVGMPAGITLPSAFMDTLVEQQVMAMDSQVGLQADNGGDENADTAQMPAENITTIQITKPDGTIDDAKVYSGTSGGFSYKAIVTSWGGDGTNTMAIALYPAGSIKMNVPTLDGMVEKEIITIDEVAVQGDILELIKNIR